MKQVLEDLFSHRRERELGWVIHRARWGNGFATEASQAALDWAWKHVDTDGIISMIQPDNVRSLRVATKIGQRFQRPGVLNGTPVHVYGIDREIAAPPME